MVKPTKVTLAFDVGERQETTLKNVCELCGRTGRIVVYPLNRVNCGEDQEYKLDVISACSLCIRENAGERKETLMNIAKLLSKL